VFGKSTAASPMPEPDRLSMMPLSAVSLDPGVERLFNVLAFTSAYPLHIGLRAYPVAAADAIAPKLSAS